ncbi:TPA: helix-turn-helix transcriptional regulator [Escherichia coli]|nr:AraC family transcriptional regulator [Escherichia coli]HEI2270303.1 AraC family transcriptional regulator [Escherichia coli]
MSTISVRTNKITIFYTGNNDVVVTNLADNTKNFCRKGSIVIVGRNVRVSFVTKEFYCDILKKAVFFDYMQIIKLKKILNLTYASNNSNLLDLSDTPSEIRKIISIKADECIKKAFDELIISNCMHDKIMSFMYFCKKTKIEQDIFNLILSSAAKTFCNRVIDLINSDISRKWSLRLLSDEFNLSEVAIRKKLEAEGVCFRKLILEIRMKEAMSLLIEGDLSVSQISADIGYNNTSYFISYFKNFFGITPKQLQSLLKK